MIRGAVRVLHVVENKGYRSILTRYRSRFESARACRSGMFGHSVSTGCTAPHNRVRTG